MWRIFLASNHIKLEATMVSGAYVSRRGRSGRILKRGLVHPVPSPRLGPTRVAWLLSPSFYPHRELPNGLFSLELVLPLHSELVACGRERLPKGLEGPRQPRAGVVRLCWPCFGYSKCGRQTDRWPFPPPAISWRRPAATIVSDTCRTAVTRWQRKFRNAVHISCLGSQPILCGQPTLCSRTVALPELLSASLASFTECNWNVDIL
ncbi:hypothetical protein B0H11DRAFT_1007059 [Mycena galericulata]|nr:hypothetical protein B0H11DRAFT_1007059 [Mycena galericulata]